MRASALVIALQAFFLLGAIPRSADAQDTPVSSPATQQATQSTSPASSTSAQAPAPAKPKPDDALDNPVIEQADEEQSITYLKSHVTFKYNHDEYDRARAATANASTGSSLSDLRDAWRRESNFLLSNSAETTASQAVTDWATSC